MVARHAATEGTQDDGTSDGGAAPKAGVKDAARQQGLFAVLEHFPGNLIAKIAKTRLAFSRSSAIFARLRRDDQTGVIVTILE
jgi:hypothetical protein